MGIVLDKLEQTGSDEQIATVLGILLQYHSYFRDVFFALQVGAIDSNRYCLQSMTFFFERTAHDVCVSINIAEKYKTMTLGGHNQAKQRETKEKQLATSGSDWDIDTATHRQPQKVGLGQHPPETLHIANARAPETHHHHHGEGPQRINHCHRQRRRCRRCPTPD